MPPGELISKLLARRFGGVTPDLLLDKATLESLKASTRPVRRRFYAWTLPALAVFTGVVAYSGARLRLQMEGPASSAILDAGPGAAVISFVVAGGMAGLYVAAWLEHFLLPRLLGLDKQTWTQYRATESGWRPRRQLVLVTLFLPMIALMFWCGLVMGDRVDENGIRFSDGLARRAATYGQVDSIELYEGIRAPAGVFMRPNLVVRFSTGTVWNYNPGRRARLLPRDVAEYIAERAGASIDEGHLRP